MDEDMQNKGTNIIIQPTPESCMKEIITLKDRLNEAERKLSGFSEVLKAQNDINQTEIEIQQIEAERAITELEIEVEELKNGGTK